MKKLALSILILGIFSIMVGLYLANTSYEISNNDPLIDSLIANDKIFIQQSDTSFSYLKFKKYNMEYVLSIKRKDYVFNNGTLNEKYSMLEYPININKDIYENTEEKISLSIKDNIVSLNNQNSNYNNLFSGNYQIGNNETFIFPEFDEGEYSGLYINPSLDYAKLLIYYQDNNYYISGSVKNKNNVYIFKSDKLVKKNSSYFFNNSIQFDFQNNNVKANHIRIENDKVNFIGGVMNNTYDKVIEIPISDLIKELDDNIKIDKNTYGYVK